VLAGFIVSIVAARRDFAVDEWSAQKRNRLQPASALGSSPSA
jgi:hypothetical protein